MCATISESPRWKRVTQAITDKGAQAGIQLSTAWEKYQGITTFVSTSDNDPISEYKSVVADLSPQDIGQIFTNLRRGIELSASAGFTHIQIHAAHGYLFSLLIDEAFCSYSELALSHLRLIARELNLEGIESSIRFSLITGDNHIDQKRSIFIGKICDLPFSFFDISFGFYNINKYLIYPNTEELIEERVASTLALAERFPNKQIILSGKSYGAWQLSLPNNVHIGICRDLIANPDFLRDRMKVCTNCMKCHYYSHGQLHLRCEKWGLVE